MGACNLGETGGDWWFWGSQLDKVGVSDVGEAGGFRTARLVGVYPWWGGEIRPIWACGCGFGWVGQREGCGRGSAAGRAVVAEVVMEAVGSGYGYWRLFRSCRAWRYGWRCLCWWSGSVVVVGRAG